MHGSAAFFLFNILDRIFAPRSFVQSVFFLFIFIFLLFCLLTGGQSNFLGLENRDTSVENQKNKVHQKVPTSNSRAFHEANLSPCNPFAMPFLWNQAEKTKRICDAILKHCNSPPLGKLELFARYLAIFPQGSCSFRCHLGITSPK